MKAKLRMSVYIALLVVLVCGFFLHVVARAKAEKYHHEKATALGRAYRHSETYLDTGNLKQQLLVIERIFLCGGIFMGSGIGLFVLWICLGGRDGMSIPLLLILFDVPLWLFP